MRLSFHLGIYCHTQDWVFMLLLNVCLVKGELELKGT